MNDFVVLWYYGILASIIYTVLIKKKGSINLFKIRMPETVKGKMYLLVLCLIAKPG